MRRIEEAVPVFEIVEASATSGNTQNSHPDHSRHSSATQVLSEALNAIEWADEFQYAPDIARVGRFAGIGGHDQRWFTAHGVSIAKRIRAKRSAVKHFLFVVPPSGGILQPNDSA